MPKLKRSAIRNLSEQNRNGLLIASESKKLDDREPKLKTGCWYVGKITGFNGRRPVVFHDSSNPVTILNGCREEIDIGQLVIYEVMTERPNYFLGEFKEVYTKK